MDFEMVPGHIENRRHTYLVAALVRFLRIAALVRNRGMVFVMLMGGGIRNVIMAFDIKIDIARKAMLGAVHSKSRMRRCQR